MDEKSMQEEIDWCNKNSLRYSENFMRSVLNRISVASLFFGTVVHALDHTHLVEICKDPFWLTCSSARWRYVETCARLIRIAFTDDHPSAFPVLCKDCADIDDAKFFTDVYRAACLKDR